MAFDLKDFEEFDVTTQERQALKRLSLNKDFDLLETVLTRWLVWRAHRLGMGPRDPEQDMELIDLQGGYRTLKKLLELVNGMAYERTKKDK